MASFTVPCPKSTSVAPIGQVLNPSQAKMSSSVSSVSVPARVSLSSAGSSSERALSMRLQGPKRNRFTVQMSQVNEVAIEGSNSVPKSSTKLEVQASDEKDVKAEEESVPPTPLSDASISAFMEEVSNIVKLVDSKDIMELHLKQTDLELTIRKKEALPQPPPATPVVMMQHSSPQSVLPPQHAPSSAVAPAAPAAPAQTPLPAPAKSGKSSLPPLTCPMAGTFYRCSGPGEPPFAKVGDKVQKGQVVCIIEAMKLMNEIEADQSGTIVEILAEDGKPVSVDTPLLVIEP
ncbi:hypothetical protein QJS04_geneDACA005177 [Acorus gramineus]|uniref:Biotin carboxyl carrier protein of acetyl-CoA carboxylase n=1 Tax=Acorus gramineus TaxID=55184 RepID=A0AAV9AYN0_ACOGR|nr:hypothetical protein QJS04_geneDACA005177 [Acorus gramineus]